ncbi:MAG: class I SAM-dependent methyltransferase [Acidimicrobiales bacterium]
MRQGHESNTAAYMALFRAVESGGPYDPRLFEDPLAIKLLPRSLRAVAGIARIPLVGRAVPALLDIGWPLTRSSGVVRTRLIDEMVVDAIGGGATQMVILGAGLDSRAYRLAEAQRVTVFEVDHPATQRAKRARLHALGTPLGHVCFLSVDFEVDDVASRLEAARFEPRSRSVVLWEGVVSYLTSAAVDHNFDLLSRLCSPASRLIFTYVDARALDGSVDFEEARRWKSWVRFNGEPFIFGFRPDELPAYLAERGFRLESDRTTAEVARSYAATLGRDEPGSDLYRVAMATRTA